MKIKEILARDRPGISFEVFPPKKDAPFAPIKDVVSRLAACRPSFISVTYGAGGGANANTAAVASFVQDGCRTTALAHLTCISSTRAQIEERIAGLKSAGVENVLCLRGDRPPETAEALPSDFAYAIDLVKTLRPHGFCLGGACYPERHPSCEHFDDDIAHLKAKVDAGIDFLTTQMFFDNNVFYRYLYKVREAGVSVPVLAGIMPVTNGRQIAHICQLSGTYLPMRFKAIVDRFGDSPAAMLDAGVAYASEQIIDLFANGVDHVHLYTMNKPEVAERIMRNLASILHSSPSIA